MPLLERHGIEADLRAPQGEVADAVVRAAADLELDMLVLGAHGYGSLNTALGSTAAAIAAKSDLPLLIIREPLKTRAGRPNGRPALFHESQTLRKELTQPNTESEGCALKL